jgi:hypothetical protein
MSATPSNNATPSARQDSADVPSTPGAGSLAQETAAPKDAAAPQPVAPTSTVRAEPGAPVSDAATKPANDKPDFEPNGANKPARGPTPQSAHDRPSNPNRRKSRAENRTVLNPPPLLCNEDQSLYDELVAAVHAAVKANDIFEEIWLSDYIANHWDILRVRRLKAALITSTQQQALEKVLARLKSIDTSGFSVGSKGAKLAQRFTLGKGSSVKQANKLLNSAGLSWDAILAEAMALNIEAIERFDRMAKTSEIRRDEALVQIEVHRKSFGPALRSALKEIQDVDFHVIERSVEARKAA